MKKIACTLAVLAMLASCGSDDTTTDSNVIVPVAPEEPQEPEQPEVPTGIVVTQYQGYQLLWNDEFDGDVLDVSKWNYETGTGINGNFGTGQLDRATDRAENVKIEAGDTNAQGLLNISTRKEWYVDRNYTSGRLNTKDKFAVGPGCRIEARVWARDVKYKGQGFAFWMMPAEKPATEDHIMWPQGGEIDIMEYVGAIPYANLGSVHYAWFWQNNEYAEWNHGHKGAYYNYQEQQVPAVNPGYGQWPVSDNNPNAGSGGYHLYRIDWYADRMEFSVDEHVYHINYFNDGDAFGNAADGQDADAKVAVNGKMVFKSEYSHHFDEWQPFAHKFFLILSAGVGGNDNMTYGGAVVPEAVFPCATLVDYIRVYKRD